MEIWSNFQGLSIFILTSVSCHQSTSMDQFPEDCLPPEHTYASRDDLFQAINDWASPRGYA
ncbi:Uncharacterized protein HZ326_21121, partial [Fusarium oxysporum f. sp. albedinis]